MGSAEPFITDRLLRVANVTHYLRIGIVEATVSVFPNRKYHQI